MRSIRAFLVAALLAFSALSVCPTPARAVTTEDDVNQAVWIATGIITGVAIAICFVVFASDSGEPDDPDEFAIDSEVSPEDSAESGEEESVHVVVAPRLDEESGKPEGVGLSLVYRF